MNNDSMWVFGGIRINILSLLSFILSVGHNIRFLVYIPLLLLVGDCPQKYKGHWYKTPNLYP